MRSKFILLLGALVVLAATQFVVRAAKLELAPDSAVGLPPHPRLLLNAEGIAQLKQRIATQPWAKASWEQLQQDTDRLLARRIELPLRGGNWSHNDVCPTHGARLHQGKKIGAWQWEHICPVGPHTLLGNPAQATLDFDGNVIADIHAHYAQEVVDCGLLYQVTGEARYAAKAREILLAYAERYPTYPLHNNQGKRGTGGRVASQSLTEASWLTTFVQGADLVWTTLSAEERMAVTEHVLRPALQEVILPHPLGIHNIQCHLNSAIGLVGYLLGDERLIAKAIDDSKIGFRQQMAKGVLADGMWTEGSSGYHFFTISGVWPLTEAAHCCGQDLYGAQLRSMFDGPLRLAMPDFVLPNFNDSSTVPLDKETDVYELAQARYPTANYEPLLAQSNRRGRLALLYGVTNVPAGAVTQTLGSRNSPASGYAMLQQGNDQTATWLCLKYGPHGGGHGHPDKNNFILYARGEIVAPDAGTHAYGSPLHLGWDKTTLAHNTLVVDETSQLPATGKCLAFGTERGVDYVVSDAGAIYPGVQFIRTVAMLNSNLVVFVDQITAEQPHTLDVVYHQIGTWEELPTGIPWTSPTNVGYRFFTGAKQLPVGPAALHLRTKLAEDWRAAITLAGDEATEVIAGYGLLKTTEDRVPMLLQRRQSKSTAFVWAVSLNEKPVMLQTERVMDAAGQPLPTADAVKVHVQFGNEQWSLLANPQNKAIRMNTGKAPIETTATFLLQ